MLGVDPELGTSALRLWVGAGSAALLVMICALSFAWLRTTSVASGLRAGVVVVGAMLGVAIAWAFFGAASMRDPIAERRALENRAQELTASALAPGSVLACLDAMAGDSVGAACEKSIFATPATVATTISYVAAQFALLSDMVGYTRRGGRGIDNALLPMRRSLEADRFGFLAYALAVRDGCTSDDCKALAFLHDPNRVRLNLGEGTLDHYLEHYLPVWTQSSEVPLADASTAQPGAMTQPGPPGSRKVTVNIDFPTAASIPPVSIMNPEPKGPVTTAAASGGNSSATASAASSRRSRKEKAGAAAVASAPPPMSDTRVDPVWTPAPATAAPQASAAGSAPAANFASGGSAPMQLSPFVSPPGGGDSTMRTQ